MSKQRRGKRKKGRGPRPPKPPEKRAPKKKEKKGTFGVFEGLRPDPAEIEAWNAAGAEGWDEEGEDVWVRGDKSVEEALKDWDQLSETDTELVNILSDFLEAHPTLCTVAQVQEPLDYVLWNRIIEKEEVAGWAAGIVHHAAAANSLLESLTPELIGGAFGVEPRRTAKWAEKVAASIQEEAEL